MSIFHPAEAVCPKCGSTLEFSVVASVNADRRPDLRAAILDRSFQAVICETCANPTTVVPHLTYMDVQRGDWILVEQVSEVPNWQTHETEALALFDDAFGAGAPAAARALAVGVHPRLVFGWPALREKLLCSELGLDDISLELVKMAVMRGADGTPLGEGLALRLAGHDGDNLKLEVIDDETQRLAATTDIPRSLYDDIHGDTAAWAALRQTFDGKAFVDLNRFLIEPVEG
jgi:hypothetical protein